jgi:photosystem II stability/assembly factor-like uncharacterized protein
MVRLFSIASVLLTVVALAAHNANAIEVNGCATPEFQPSADAELRSRVQSAYAESLKKRHPLTSVAHAQGSPPPTFADLREIRGYMKKIDETVRSMSVQEREKALGNIREFVDKLTPKTILEAEFLHAIQFSGSSLGWALDWNGMIERTSDGGVTWTGARVASLPKLLERIDPNSGIFRSMHFADAKFGVIVGVHPVYWTADGGSSWHEVRPPSLFHQLNAVFCDPSHGCWVGGNEPNAIYRREANQSAWAQQKSPAKGPITAIQFIGSTGWAVSNAGEIIGTADGGHNWSELFRDDSKRFKALHFVDEQHGWVVGNRALIMSTRDGGKTWVDQTILTPPGFPVDEVRLNAVKFVDGQRGWAAGLHGMIFGTTDGGGCWTIQRFEGISAHTLTINALEIADGPTVWAAGNAGNIFVSTDGGAFWFPVHGVALDIMHEIKRALDERAKQ